MSFARPSGKVSRVPSGPRGGRGPTRVPARIVTETRKEGPSVVKKAEKPIRSALKKRHMPKKGKKKG